MRTLTHQTPHPRQVRGKPATCSATSSGRSPGHRRTYLQDLCGYWAGRYDWRATEARLNQIPQFTTTIDGLDIHFLHLARCSGQAAGSGTG